VKPNYRFKATAYGRALTFALAGMSGAVVDVKVALIACALVASENMLEHHPRLISRKKVRANRCETSRSIRVKLGEANAAIRRKVIRQLPAKEPIHHLVNFRFVHFVLRRKMPANPACKRDARKAARPFTLRWAD
jgi:hypothetical protein